MSVQELVEAKQLLPLRKHTVNPTTFDTRSSYIGEEVLNVLASMIEANIHLTCDDYKDGQRSRTNEPLGNRGRRAQYHHGSPERGNSHLIMVT